MGGMTDIKKEAKKKGNQAAFAAVGTGVLAYATLSPIVVLGGVAYTGYLTWKWFKFRAEWGMRF